MAFLRSTIHLSFLASFLILGSCSLTPKNTQQKHPTQPVEIETREVTYGSHGVNMTGYIAQPKNLKGKAPGVLVVHEWWGQTDYPRKRADMLARLGYVAMAVDMYGNRIIADHPAKAGKFAKAVMSDSKKVNERFKVAMKAFKMYAPVQVYNIAAIGYCFGGSVVLEAARIGLPLKGVVGFHSGIITPTKAKKGNIKAKILVLNGADDKMVTPEQVKTFKEEMKSAGADFEYINYENAKHGFTNPDATKYGKKFNIPLAYNKKADEASWTKLKIFLKEIF